MADRPVAKATEAGNDHINWRSPVMWIAVSMSVFHLYTAYRGVIGLWEQRAVHLSFVLLLVYLTKPLTRPTMKGLTFYIAKALDIIAVVAVIGVDLYMILNAGDIQWRVGVPNYQDKVAATVLGILVLEASRRIVGPAMTIITGVFLLYVFYGSYLPGRLSHPGFSYSKIVDQMFNTTGGILGAPIGAAAVFIVIFIIFGAVLNASGAGDFFNKLSRAVAGKAIGGPAKTAIVASALTGTVSGSAVANVATTGAFTIPIMIRNGYQRHFAGAVEAAASTGGQFMPPVMGATAFVIAEFTQTPYYKIALYALFPAILYYLGIYLMVHFEALRTNIKPLEDDQIPDLKETLLEGGHYLLALLLLIVTLARGLSPMKAGFYSIVLLIALSFIRKETRMSFKDIIKALEEGARGTLIISTATAAAGLIVGSISLTGLGLKLSAAVVSISGGHLIIALIFTMIASLILGMGMISISAYIILASLVAPALVRMGTIPVAAHLFVYFFGILSNVTPPVAVAAYTGAGIAGADQTKTAITATRLALVAFIIPFMFVLDQRIMLIGPIPSLIVPMITAIIGVAAMAAGLQGWLYRRTIWWERVFFIAGSVLLLHTGSSTDVIGLSLVLIAFLSQWLSHKRRRSAVEAQS